MPEFLPTIRDITVQDDIQIACLIRQVMKEHGADREGFAFVDPELDSMSLHYNSPQSAYLVLEFDGRIVGGGGFGPLTGSPEGIAELRKMYFSPMARGRGWGSLLLGRLLTLAKAAAYTQLYLETLASMQAANRLYLRNDFRELAAPLGATGHFSCDRWMIRPL